MAIRVLDGAEPSSLERLVDDYLNHCRARGLSPRTLDNSYGYSLHNVFLPWCRREGVASLSQLDGRTFDRFTSSLFEHKQANGQPLSKHSVHSYVRPIRQLLAWASKEGEEVKAKPQLPRCPKPLRE